MKTNEDNKMTLAGRSLVSVDDLSNGEIESLFSLVDEMSADIRGQHGLMKGYVMASLFFEPSTRTRLSFETAMHRLGGSVITVVDAKGTAMAKGESIADMARVIGSYADIIVIRHPWEGAAKVMADYAGVPVINAGDGSHEHPTQTLCDLYTIKTERKTLSGLKIALWGDLKYGRTIHSLTFALARFGATILFRPGPGLELPEHVIRKLNTEYGGEVRRYQPHSQGTDKECLPLDAVYMTPNSPHQLAMMPDISVEVELEKGVDALYVTRLQKERIDLAPGDTQASEQYPVVDGKLLKEREFIKTIIMHPLPRVDELAYEVDADPRSMYFKQAARGVPVRMALISLLLGVRKSPLASEESPSRIRRYPLYNRISGLSCPNPKCVTTKDTEKKYLAPQFHIVSVEPLTLRCIYCEHEISPPFIASAEWHERMLEHKRYHSANSHWARKIRTENLICFPSTQAAEAQGFKPSHYAKAEGKGESDARGEKE